MKLSDIKDVLTFQAFRPDPDDSTAPVNKRLIGKKYLCLNINKDSISWRQVDRKGHFGQSGIVLGQLKEALAEHADEWRGLTDGGWVVVSLNNRFFITLESNMSRKPGSETTIRTNARSVIGSKYDRNKRYAIHHNQETSASMLLSCEDSLVRGIEDSLKQAGFQIARISCGLFAMVEDYVRREHDSRDGGSGQDFTLIACCDGSVCVLAQKGGQWTDLRSRPSLYTEDDVQPVLSIASPVLSGIDATSKLVVIHDQQGTDTSRQLLDLLQTRGAEDLTQEDHLWAVLTNN